MAVSRTCAKCGVTLSAQSALDVCSRCVAAEAFAPAHRKAHPGADIPAGFPLPADGPLEQPGDRIGRYKLLQKLGEGGCGIVYMAEQEEPVRRRIALKIIKLGMDTRSVVARFEAERQVLALMDHPHIARIYDGGTTATGRPYFAMELVRGIRITEYCDEHQLSTTQRLDLFMQVCQAVQHAHQKGIIHRDLKPSNILVSINDGVPVPKVIDFGVAKATEQRLTDRTLFTEFHQLIGTPAYMSPEQAMMTNLDIDTRSDIYSLGVVLYELLTGRPPFDPRKMLAVGMDEVRRTLRELEPPRPSTRLSTLAAAELTTTARRRSTEAPKLLHAIRGDLDWIVMKCLEKDRTRRYETATGLASDLKRHLSHEPIVARPPSALYTFRKLMRRHRVAFTAGAAVVAALLAGLATSTSLFVKERATRRRAQSAEEAAITNAQHVVTLAEENRQRLLRLQIDTGARHLREGDLMGALPWFVEAFTLDHDDPAHAAAHQFRLASILQQCPRPLQILFHTGSVSRARFSPDGARVLSFTRADAAVIWDANTGQPLASATVGKALDGATFSPDGQRAVVEGSQHSFLWDFNKSPPAARSLDTNGPVLRAAWNQAGTQFITVGTQEVATVWDGNEGHAVGWLRHDKPATILTASFVPRALAQPDEKTAATSRSTNAAELILTVDSGGVLRFWEPATGALVTERVLEPRSSPWQLAQLNADGSRLITVHNPDDLRVPSHARLWSVRAARPVSEAIGHDSFILPPLFAQNQSVVITGSHDKTVRIWDTRTGALKVSPLRHASAVTSLALSRDANLLVTGCADGTARIWSVALGREVGPPLLHGGVVNDVQFGSANHLVLTASTDGMVRLWNVAAAPRLRWKPQTAPRRNGVYGNIWGTLNETAGGLEFLGLRPGEPRFVPVSWRGKFAPGAGASVTRDGQFLLVPQEMAEKIEYQLFSITTGQPCGPVFSVPGNAETVSGTALSTDGTRFAVRSGNTLQLWNPAIGKPLAAPIASSSRPSMTYLSPDGRTLIWRTDGKVVVWDIAAGEERFAPLAQSGQMSPAGFSADSRWILTVTDGTGADSACAQVWDAATGRPVAPPLRHSDSVNWATFSADGRWIVTASKDGTARVWEAATGEPRTPPLEHPGEVWMASFSHEHQRVFTACDDGAVREWDASSGEPLATPIQHFFPVRYVFPLLGGRFLHSTSQHTHRWELSDAPRPLEEWEALAQLLSARRLEPSGRLRLLDRAEMGPLWSATRVRLPKEFVTSLAQREDWNNWLTQMYFANGHKNKALPFLNELVALQPDLFIHRWNRAYACKNPNRWEIAVEDLKAAARLDPAENAVWPDLAMAELVLGNLPGYRAACAEMVERLTFADRKAYLGEWCLIACDAPNPPEIVQGLHALLEELGPPAPPTLYVRARDGLYYAALGALSFRMGRDAEAIQHLEKARTRREGDRTTLLFLAMARYRVGRVEEARAMLELVRGRIAEDERMFDLGRTFDSYGGLAVSKLLLREADEMMR